MKSITQILQEFKNKVKSYYWEDYVYYNDLPKEILAELIGEEKSKPIQEVIQNLLDHTFRENIEAIANEKIRQLNQKSVSYEEEKKQIEDARLLQLEKLGANEQEQRDALNGLASYFYGRGFEWEKEEIQEEKPEVKAQRLIREEKERWRKFSSGSSSASVDEDFVRPQYADWIKNYDFRKTGRLLANETEVERSLADYTKEYLKAHPLRVLFPDFGQPENGLYLLRDFLKKPLPEKIGLTHIPKKGIGNYALHLEESRDETKQDHLSSSDMAFLLALREALKKEISIQSEAGYILLAMSGGIASQITFIKKPAHFPQRGFQLLKKVHDKQEWRAITLYHTMNEGIHSRYHHGKINIYVPFGYRFITADYIIDVSFVGAPIFFSQMNPGLVTFPTQEDEDDQ
ncbi:MAG: hypothetical protein AAFQ92_04525 [Bacteroidota bacterium]